MSFLRALEVGNLFFFLTSHYILLIQYLKEQDFFFQKQNLKRQKLDGEDVLYLVVAALDCAVSSVKAETKSAQSLWDKVYSRSHFEVSFLPCH